MNAERKRVRSLEQPLILVRVLALSETIPQCLMRLVSYHPNRWNKMPSNQLFCMLGALVNNKNCDIITMNRSGGFGTSILTDIANSNDISRK